jgi:hypothetical protein
MSQNDSVLMWLQRGKTLTPMQALEKFGCFRLAARVHDLRMSGHNIEANDYVLPSGKRVARYSMKVKA